MNRQAATSETLNEVMMKNCYFKKLKTKCIDLIF